MAGRKTLVWCLSLFTLLLVLLPLSLYLLSPILAQRGLEYWLQQQQFSYIELNMQHPAWNEIRIDRIHLQRNRDDQQLDIRSGEILIRFSPYELFFNKRLSLLQLPQSDITLTYTSAADSNPSDADADTVDLRSTLPESWFPKIPVDQVQIGALNLTLDYPDQQPDWRFSGALQLDTHELYSRVHFNRNGDDLGWSDLHLYPDNRIALRLLQQDQAFVTLNGQLAYQDQLTLDSAQRIDLAGLQAWLEKMQPLPTLPPLQGTLETQGQARFPLQTRFTPDTLLRSVQTSQQLQGELKSQLPQIKQLAANLSGQLDFSLNQLNLSLDQQSHIRLQQLSNEALSKPLAQIDLQLRQPLHLITDLAPLLQGQTPDAVTSPLDLTISSSPIHLESLQVEPLTLALHLDGSALSSGQFNGTLSSNSIALKAPGQPLPKFSLHNQFSLTQTQFKQQFQINTDTLPLKLNGRASTELTSQDTQFNWQLSPVPLAGLGKKLLPYLQLPAPLSFTQGTFYHKGSGRWQAGRFNARADNSIRNADLLWDEIRLNDLQLDSVTTLLPSGTLRDKGSIHLQRVITGVEIDQIETGYQLELGQKQRTLALNDTRAQLLQGNLTLAPLSFDLDKPDLEARIGVNKVDLGAVLQLERQQGLSGEGKLSGSFPLKYSNGEFSISDGLLAGDAPGGRITFQPTATVAAYAASNRGLQIALEALQNFHFELLSVQLNYAPDGTAFLKTRLKGHNPDWQQGHPVDFTVNIEENIPKLIKTLQFADKLTRTIEKRYR